MKLFTVFVPNEVLITNFGSFAISTTNIKMRYNEKYNRYTYTYKYILLLL